MARRPYTYSKEEILADLTRTAETLGCARLTKGIYDTHGSIATSTVMRHFGGWLKALKAAGMACAVNDRRETGWEDVAIEFEYNSRKFQAHGHDPARGESMPSSMGTFGLTRDGFCANFWAGNTSIM